MERILVFLKPDGINLRGIITDLFSSHGLQCNFVGTVKFTESLLRKFYPHLAERSLLKTTGFFQNHELPVFIVSGNNITLEIKSLKKEIRRRHGKGRTGAAPYGG